MYLFMIAYKIKFLGTPLMILTVWFVNLKIGVVICDWCYWTADSDNNALSRLKDNVTIKVLYTN
jgi:hypothetical protein